MCDFCETKKFLPMKQRGAGDATMADEFNAWLGKEIVSGVQFEETDNGAFLSYDNSAREYGCGLLKIVYCPLCGRKLMEEMQ